MKQNVIRNAGDDPEGPRHQRADLLLPRRRPGASSPARTPASRTRRRAGASSSSRATRSASSGQRGRQAHADLPGPTTTPRTTAAASSATAGSSRPTSATRRADRQRPADRLVPAVRHRRRRRRAYCKLDVAVGTAGADLRRRRRTASTSRRPADLDAGVSATPGPFPTSDTAAGGCGRRDATGAPLADAVKREPVRGRRPDRLRGGGHRAVAVGRLLRVERRARAPSSSSTRRAGSSAGSSSRRRARGSATFTYGTPFGLAVGRTTAPSTTPTSTSSPDRDGIGPGPDGKVWRIRFVDGAAADTGDDRPGPGLPRRPRASSRTGTCEPADAGRAPSRRTYAYGPERHVLQRERAVPDTAVGRRRCTSKWRFPTGAIVTGVAGGRRGRRAGRGHASGSSSSCRGTATSTRCASTTGRSCGASPGTSSPAPATRARSSAHVEEVDGRAARARGGRRELLLPRRRRPATKVWRFAAGTGCVDAAGPPARALCASTSERNEILSSPIVADGKVYFGMDVNEWPTGKGGFYAVDVRSGTLELVLRRDDRRHVPPGPHDQVRTVRRLPHGRRARPAGGLLRHPSGLRLRPRAQRLRRRVVVGGDRPRADGRCTSASSNCDTEHRPGEPAGRGRRCRRSTRPSFSLDLDGDPRWRWRPAGGRQRRPRLRGGAEPLLHRRRRRELATSSASATRTAPTTSSTATA